MRTKLVGHTCAKLRPCFAGALREGKRASSRQYAVGRPVLYCLLLPAYCLLLSGCTRDPKFQQYYVRGEALYIKNCSNCHQKNGKGLGLVYPPLDQSDFMKNNYEEVICLIGKGVEGEMVVNGRSFNQAMPGIPSLTSLEIAEIATYIYNTWEHDRGLIDVKQTEKMVNACK